MLNDVMIRYYNHLCFMCLLFFIVAAPVWPIVPRPALPVAMKLKVSEARTQRAPSPRCQPPPNRVGRLSVCLSVLAIIAGISVALRLVSHCHCCCCCTCCQNYMNREESTEFIHALPHDLPPPTPPQHLRL